MKCPKSINKQKVVEIINVMDSKPNTVNTILEAKQEYTGMTAAHGCCRHGHLAILKRIVDLHTNVCAITDNFGNLPLHHLCQNTTTKQAELRVMLEIIIHANRGAKT